MKLKNILKDPMRDSGGLLKVGILLLGALGAMGCNIDYNSYRPMKQPGQNPLQDPEIMAMIREKANKKRLQEIPLTDVNMRIATPYDERKDYPYFEGGD